VNGTVLAANELGPDELARWSALRDGNAVYRSPFFAPAFTQAVAHVRDVRVAIIEDAGAVVGILPFELHRSRAGWPVGSGFSDYHGVLMDREAELNPLAVIRACGISGWSFDHMPAELGPFRPYVHGRGASPYLDLRAGFDAYLEGRRERSAIRDRGRRARRLEREAGPLRFVAASDSAQAFELLVAWKREQYARTGVRDVLADARALDLLRAVHDAQGMLSVLYAGDDVAAVHLGLRCGAVLHSWFPAYNADLNRHSPGLTLMFALAEAAPGLGITEIDLGKGDARYKQALATGSVELWEGYVGRHPLAGRLRSSARRMARSAGVHRAVRRALRR
jgi:CelD/BcsL family acetyltransferase involved in cellulose biosynthesis